MRPPLKTGENKPAESGSVFTGDGPRFNEAPAEDGGKHFGRRATATVRGRPALQ